MSENSHQKRVFGQIVADRVGFEPTSLLRDYLISSVVPRTDFSGSWAKIAPLFGSLGGPSKPLVSRRFYPQSRMASRKIRTHPVSPQNGLQNRKKERIWGERREIRREIRRSSAVGQKDERCMAWTHRPNIKTY